MLIHYESCHPNERKFAGVNLSVNTVVRYPMPHSEMEKEASIRQHILNANEFNQVDK
jgi:hypothetical protein